jgi:hypothetical protein
MKGTFFQKPLEFQLHIEGEGWQQGAQIQGRLEVRNHGVESLPSAGLRVHLAYGVLKKVRQKSADAFTVLASKTPSDISGMIPAQGSTGWDWSFQTDQNCPITDSAGSLFLLYGQGEALEQLGQLQLSFKHAPIVEEFLKTLETDFRFVRKSQKFAKGRVESKMSPPDSKAFSTVDELVLSSCFDGPVLELEYSFKIKKIEATAASFDLKKEKRELSQQFKPEDLRVPSGRVNYERIEKSIREALSLVESKIIY